MATEPAPSRADDAELEQRLRATERFIELAGHDLRTPLSVVSGALAYLNQHVAPRLGPGDRHMLDIADRSVERLGRMLDGLLTYARSGLEAGEHVVVDLEQTVADAHEQVPELTLDAGPLPKVHGHPVLLEHLFTNLLTNAYNHARPHTPPRVIIRASREGDRWHIVVEDNGTGIPPEHRDRVLLPFERLDNRVPTSTGLGLAIVGRVAEAHGSPVRIDDSRLGGAAFDFTLPAADDT